MPAVASVACLSSVRLGPSTTFSTEQRKQTDTELLAVELLSFATKAFNFHPRPQILRSINHPNMGRWGMYEFVLLPGKPSNLLQLQFSLSKAVPPR